MQIQEMVGLVLCGAFCAVMLLLLGFALYALCETRRPDRNLIHQLTQLLQQQSGVLLGTRLAARDEIAARQVAAGIAEQIARMPEPDADSVRTALDAATKLQQGEDMNDDPAFIPQNDLIGGPPEGAIEDSEQVLQMVQAGSNAAEPVDEN